MNKIMIKGILVALFLMGCAQKQMAVTNVGDSSKTIVDYENKITKAYEEQWDVLSYEELSKAEAVLKDAKKHSAASDNTDKLSKDFLAFDDHYNRAQTLADARSPKVQGLLTTRRQIIDKGVRNYTDENKAFAKLDNEFRDLSEKKIVNARDYSELQNKYIELGNRAAKKKVLGSVRFQIEEAKKDKAKRYAPRSLNQAELDLKNAENVMDANVNQPDSYNPAVRKANRSAAMLSAIIAEQKKVKYNLDESAAQKIVEQSGQIDNMNLDLAATETTLSETRQDLADAEAQARADAEAARGQMDEQGKKLSDQQATAESEKSFQSSLLSAQQQFSPSEADVYRQGNKILIRLKSIGFASGKADIPEKSKALLERVSKVAEDLDATEIVVEGHTDSVGSAAVNDTISQKRAESVMSYLQTEGIEAGKIQAVGYGFQKPLSSNNTTTGRAQNRRVDVWISPTETTKTE